jgi:hypothetical protein
MLYSHSLMVQGFDDGALSVRHEFCRVPKKPAPGQIPGPVSGLTQL